MENMFEFETERFITAVEARPAIWNVDVPEYTMKIEKLKAWDEMCEIMYPDYQAKKLLEKRKLGKILQRKWRSLRDSFTRELNAQKKELESGMIKSNRKQYVYFNQLIFLLTSAEKRKAIASLTRFSPSASPKQSEIIPHLEQQCLDIKSEEIPVTMDSEKDKRLNPHKRRPEDMLSIKLKLPQEMPERITEKKPISAYSTTDNQDRLFLLSLENDLKKVPEEYKLDAKSEMILALKKWQRQQTTAQASTSHSTPTSIICASTQTQSP